MRLFKKQLESFSIKLSFFFLWIYSSLSLSVYLDTQMCCREFLSEIKKRFKDFSQCFPPSLLMTQKVGIPHTPSGIPLKANISMRVIQFMELYINFKEHLLRIYTELNNSTWSNNNNKKKNIKSSKGKTTNNIQRNPHKVKS